MKRHRRKIPLLGWIALTAAAVLRWASAAPAAEAQERDGLAAAERVIVRWVDDHKAEAFDWHRKFLKPGGTCIITTPRDQWRGRAFYTVMADIMNFGYRELMTVEQLGLYAYENGFNIERAGVIKAHNGLICRPR